MAPAQTYFGVEGSSVAWLLAHLAAKEKQQLIVCRDSKEMEEIYHDLTFFLGASRKVERFPPWDTLPFEYISPQSDILAQRMRVLHSLSEGEDLIVISCPDALMQKVIPRRILRSLTQEFKIGSIISRPFLEQKFLSAGYRFVSLVEEIGDVALRGNVVDIFNPLYVKPARLEFVGDTIESIRFFNPETQRSEESTNYLTAPPIREFSGELVESDESNKLEVVLETLKARASEIEVPLSELERLSVSLRERIFLPGIEQFIGHIYTDTCSLMDYLASQAALYVVDRANVENSAHDFGELVNERHKRFLDEHRLVADPTTLYINSSEFISRLAQFRTVNIETLLTISPERDHELAQKVLVLTHKELSLRITSKLGSGSAFTPLIEQITTWRELGYRIAFVVGSDSRAARLEKILIQNNLLPEILNTSGIVWSQEYDESPLVILKGELEYGFSLPQEKLVFIAETEVFYERSYRHNASKVRSVKKFMSALAQLKDGDYIVHVDYGVGLYHGLSHRVVEGKGHDFLHIEYAAGTRLFLPVEHIGKIQKFISKEGVEPQLDKLGSGKWAKKKAKVRQAVVSLAGELIKLYASRKALRGWRFEPFGAEDERFSDGFGFEETPDQMRAIRETLSDMANEQPMDRLICGDAGFGKTEVALRAAFKCIQHGRQVALLVPTTILAEQHYSVFRNRFMEYPVNVGVISRFHGTKKNSETLASLKSGNLDIVIGTHKLLQPAIEFKDLGLLIIDEEHRFGVKHKERLKQLRKNVDVLTLTATPIPRTLHMALLGIREISIITTPPQDRRVIRTYVASYEENLIRDAIIRELQRSGQCFFVHNKVRNIGMITKELSDLVPEARFEFAHGQMHENELEKIMYRFIKREIDVLVCTTIIESGLDIPNANTIIINRADQLGLAQLYQLRGRVGRGNKQAYAYLLVPETKKLNDDAKKRLHVLQSLDDLGLGFNLAARDLEIRGAGNLLGKDQSGNVQSVGLDLYNRILKEAILNMRGEELELSEAIDPEMRVPVDAYIPPNYIPDISERLILYQRLADISSNQVAWELYSEIEDRFGHLPVPVHNLLQLMRLRSLLRVAGITRIQVGDWVDLTFSPLAKINPTKVNSLISSDPEHHKQRGKLTISLRNDSIDPEDPVTIIEPCHDLIQKISDTFLVWL